MQVQFLLSEYNFIFYILLGSIVGIFYYSVYSKNLIGGYLFSILISIFGGILGGKFLRHPISYLQTLFHYYNIDFLSVVLGSLFLLFIFYFLSKKIIR